MIIGIEESQTSCEQIIGQRQTEGKRRHPRKGGLDACALCRQYENISANEKSN